MLNEPKRGLVEALITGSTREELLWLSGYLAGVAGEPRLAAPATRAEAPITAEEPRLAAAPAVDKITIAYGTETGNSKRLAADFAARAKKKGIQPKLVSLEQYRLNDLAKEEYFFTVISTQGDGEPPAAAKKFYDHIHQGAQRLDRLKYSVLALGDTAYPLFCKAGEDVDLQLEKIGGRRIRTMQKCDTDYEAPAGQWFDQVLQELSAGALPGAGAAIAAQQYAAATAAQRPTPATPLPAATPQHTSIPRRPAKKTYTGTVLSNVNLNDHGSQKETYHLEIAAEDVDYQPGDSIGVVPENPAATVDAIVSLTGVDPAKSLVYRGEEQTILTLLTKKLNIIYLPERVVNKYAAIVRQEIPETRIGLPDLLKIYPVKDALQFEAVIGILEPIAPRLYSISSSPGAHGGEVHLTVAKDTFTVNGETKHGFCSGALSQLSPDQSLEFYVHKNAQFRLPAPDKDIIMIGPGTGIAPFRSFLAERDATGAGGRNWLFFGDQHFTTDFLYQTEIQDWIQTGLLTHIDVAFSRDREDKVYVQHKIRKQAARLYEWLEAGAYVYLCGAKEPMSMDVENTLLEIIQQNGGKSDVQARGYLDELREAGRYLKDVY